ncbi:2140_t:CDS:2 [Paraglomus brasilianum]|uniref:2140_t:CDS:1 n=1 Tax=Paraglomus brasilianum TaxID=144538 RepID=A0A9N9DI09_9GLOM|nr:2140_t:CDS:2 [Paraglomus brasilianum]
MPMLWKSPFDYVASDLIQITRRAKCLIQIYLSSLSSEDKLLLKQLGFEFEDNSPHLFNYASYLDELHYLAISRTMQMYFLGVVFRHSRDVEDTLIQHLLKTLLSKHTSIRNLKFEYTYLSVTEANAYSNVISSIIKSQRPGLKSFKLEADYHKAGIIAEALETQIGKLETVALVRCDFVDFGLREWMEKMARAGVRVKVRDCRLANPSTGEEPIENFVLLKYL